LERFIPMHFSDPSDDRFVQIAGAEKKDEAALESLPLAMAYVPRQRWNTTYEPETGFVCGTIFPELNLPFTGRRGE